MLGEEEGVMEQKLELCVRVFDAWWRGWEDCTNIHVGLNKKNLMLDGGERDGWEDLEQK